MQNLSSYIIAKVIDGENALLLDINDNVYEFLGAINTIIAELQELGKNWGLNDVLRDEKLNRFNWKKLKIKEDKIRIRG